MDLTGIPPVTKCYFCGILTTTLAVKLNYVKPIKLYFNPSKIIQGEVWRLITPFVYFGDFSIIFLFTLSMVFRYCKSLEEQHYRGKCSEFLMFFLFSATLILISATVLSLPWTSMAFRHVFIYLWSRRNPNTLLSVFGFVIRAPYLPYVFLLLGFLFDGSILEDLVGILVGHVYYFLEDVFPRQEGGFKLLKTPVFLKRLLDESYRPEPQNHNVDLNEFEERQNQGQDQDQARPGGYDFGGEALPNLSESSEGSEGGSDTDLEIET